jgi:hypothetical protein
MDPAEVQNHLGALQTPWWIAGGWAIDLHLGRQTRKHDDTDVLILRDDQSELQRALQGWDLHAADPPGSLRPWQLGETLPEDVHDVWCRRTPTSPWNLQIMIDNATDGIWIYRRDPRIRRPIEDLDGPASHVGRRVLAPEVQLLQKSKAPRPKDEADFAAVREALSQVQRTWLATSLSVVSPDHHWLAEL